MSQYHTNQFESTDLKIVRLDRAFNDPVIVHRYAVDWAPQQSHDIYDDIRTARLQQAREIAAEEQITEVTVPEAVVYLSTATLDSSCATPEIVDIYQHAYRNYLHTWTGVNLDELPSPLNEDPKLTDYQKDMYNKIRMAIKTDRDRWFIENRYDDLDIDVPKTHWTGNKDLVSGEDMDATVRDLIDDL